MTEAVSRQIETLRLLPRYPASVTAGALLGKLEAAGYSVSKRTIERDLQKLSARYPLVCDEQEEPFRWSWSQDARQFDIPAMDRPTALTFALVHQHLSQALPPDVLGYLQPHFSAADKLLNSEASGLGDWRQRIRFLPRGFRQLPPRVDREAQEAVYSAVLKQRVLKIVYHPSYAVAPKTYDTVNPMALVVRDQITYLLCRMWGYEDVRQLVLHRVKHAEMLTDECRPSSDFDVDDYIRRGEFGFSTGNRIHVKLIFQAGAGKQILEKPMSADQAVQALDDGRICVRGTVLESEELYWWLQSFAHEVEVVEPLALRKEVSRRLHAALEQYGCEQGDGVLSR